MSPRPGDQQIRTALIETAARLLAEEGPHAVTTRRLARELDTSTMAVYTYFDGMEALHRAVRREGFARLATHVAQVKPSRDPVADLTLSGVGYARNALQNPHLYRAMFLEPFSDVHEADVGLDVFETLVQYVQRCMDEGRFPDLDDAWRGATQCWVMSHGAASLVLAGMFPIDEARDVMLASALTSYVGFGDERARAQASIRSALRRAQLT